MLPRAINIVPINQMVNYATSDYACTSTRSIQQKVT